MLNLLVTVRSICPAQAGVIPGELAYAGKKSDLSCVSGGDPMIHKSGYLIAIFVLRKRG